MKLKKIYILFIGLITITSLVGCNNKKNEYNAYSKTYFEYFNTVCTITGFEKNQDDFVAVIEQITPLIEKYHNLYDIYYEYSNINNICTINKKAGKEPVIVEQELIDLLKYSISMYEKTNGMMNIAMGSVLKLWHDEREYATYNPFDARVPLMTELETASLHTNINDIIIDDENNTVYLKDEELSLDVGAIAKGYAVEQVATYLTNLGKTSYMVNFGGNIKLIGPKANDEKWKVGIQNPDLTSENVNIVMLALEDYSIVTSGSYQRYYMVDNIKYHHIIDPISLMPKNDYQSVTIVTKNSAFADTLSTALFNMNIEDGKKLIAENHDTYAMWIDSNNQIHYSDGFENLLLEE